MRNLCLLLTAIFYFSLSCKKSSSDVPARNSEQDNFLQANSLMGFAPINDVSGSYLTETSLVSLSSLFGGDAPGSISDGNLTINFISDFYKIDPSPFNWDGSWGVSPNVESSDPHALYNTATSPASLVLSKPVTTFGLELFWDGSVDFKVEFWKGSVLVGDVVRSFIPATTMGQAFLFAATHPNGFDRIIFTPLAPTAFGFAIAQIRYAETQTMNVHFDILPGSCVNPYNIKAQGQIPVVIAGNASLNVQDIDLSTVNINGVPVSQKSFVKMTSAYAKTTDCDCAPSSSDGYMDLSLKFERPAISATLGNVADGSQVTLTLKGKLKNGTSIEGRDCVRIKK
jgi:hypothetical protein